MRHSGKYATGVKYDKRTGYHTIRSHEMRAVKTHRFNGKLWDVDVEGCKGVCQTGLDRPVLSIARPVATMKESLPYGNDKYARLMLITLLHECLHASDWDKSEKVVDRTAVDVGRLLWRLGYRRCP